MARKPSDNDEMRSDYDFSGATERARAAEFSSSDPWSRQAIEADRARWLAEGLHQVQRLECQLVMFLVLARHERILDAAERAIHLLEGHGEGMAAFASGLARDGASSNSLAERLAGLAAERPRRASAALRGSTSASPRRQRKTPATWAGVG